MVLAILCPGQGSQTPGFLTPWLDVPGVAEQLQRLSDAAELDLIHYGTQADEETIKDTAIAQPLIVAASLVSARAAGLDATPQNAVIAGHSVGEFAAAALAGIFSDEDAMRLVSQRAQAMALATKATPTGMSAVLGGDQDEVLAAIESANLTPANVNGGGQIVAAGAVADLERFATEPPAKARVIPLKVAGAFHTSYMEAARARLGEAAPSYSPADPARTILTNFDGSEVSTGGEYLSHLVEQVARPVRWDLTMETMGRLGVSGIIELAPAGTLVGIAKRVMKGVPSVGLKTPEDLGAAANLVSEMNDGA